MVLATIIDRELNATLESVYVSVLGKVIGTITGVMCSLLILIPCLKFQLYQFYKGQSQPLFLFCLRN